MHKNTFLKDYKNEIDLFIAAALKEDIGNGEHKSCEPFGQRSRNHCWS